MTQPESQPDGSAPLSRRDLLRLGAASLGAPLLAASDDASGSGRSAGSSPC